MDSSNRLNQYLKVVIVFFMLLCFYIIPNKVHAASSEKLHASSQQFSQQNVVKQSSRCVLDDAQHEVCLTVSPSALRVVSLAPHLTEAIAFVDGFKHLVAVDAASDHPNGVERLPKLGGLGAIGPEHIIKHKPDLVLVWGSGMHNASIHRLKSLGFQVFISEPQTIEEVYSTFVRLSKLLGTEHAVHERLKAWMNDWQILFKQNNIKTPRVKGSTHPTVFFQVWQNPIITLGGQHIISDIIQRCGGVNVFADVQHKSFSVQVESILMRNPDLFLTTAQPALHDVALQRFMAQWRNWPQLHAVKRKSFVVLSADPVVRMGPRLLIGGRQICKAIDIYQ